MGTLNRRLVIKDVLWVFLTIGLVIAVVRFLRGLGATTGLNDTTPWGLWIGFDVMAGVALAAGGFVLAATVYIFQLEKYRPLVRPAILTALLGYLAVIVGLLFDLGLPWHIWMPIFNWQHHSPLFEVAWCVMLYTTVLLLEFTPTVLEHSWFQKPIFQAIHHWLKRLTLPLVILGITLSTLHQSSLGSLFLIMPFRLHPLWYSPILPPLFFVSAIALGLMMVTLEGFFSAYLFGHRLKLDLFSSLARAAALVLWLYLALRLGDLVLRGVLPIAFSGSRASILFWFELGISAILPAILLSLPRVRTHAMGLLTAAGLVVSGMILNRLSVSLIAIARAPGTTYFPTWMEFAVTLAIVSGALLVFIFFAENLKIFHSEMEHVPSAYSKPEFDSATGVYTSLSLRHTVARRSLVLLLVVGITVALLPAQAVSGAPQPSTPVQAARGWNPLRIDGNRDRGYVDFDHLAHQKRLKEAAPIGQDICLTCHHLSKPNDQATACWECHRDMYLATSIFNHSLHQTELGGNISCSKCHTHDHTRDSAKPCAECHDTMIAAAGKTRFSEMAPGYKDALHGTCINCHVQEAAKRDKADLALCTTCHKADPNAIRSKPTLTKP